MIYEPAEDSFLMCETLEKNIFNKNLKIIEVGTGSGYILKFLKDKGFLKIRGLDINQESVKLCIKKGFDVILSDLFSKLDKKEKFDLIIFNPPYLPEDKLEDKNSKLSTTGGKNGSEIINRFLKDAKPYLEKEGKIYLLTSSLTKGIKWLDYNKKIVGRKKLFFEELKVWELS